MKASDDLITKWMIILNEGLFKNQNYFKLLHFKEFLHHYSKEQVSPEHIFLILYNKGYISTHKSYIKDITDKMALGIKCESDFLSIKFHLTDKGAQFLQEELFKTHKDNQLKLDI